jgi:hypothetical protein
MIAGPAVTPKRGPGSGVSGDWGTPGPLARPRCRSGGRLLTQQIARRCVGSPTLRAFCSGVDSVYCPQPAGVTKGVQMHRDRVVEFAALSLLIVLVAALYAGIFF